MISICILTKNAAPTLRATLESVRLFPEVIILDNGSTDQTEQIARSFPNVRYHTAPFIGFGPLRNLASSYASHDWILALDSDEILSPTLALELQILIPKPEVAYLVPRHNFYNGKKINSCGWGNEKVARLYHRKQTAYCESQVHEALLRYPLLRLNSPILHTPYRSTADFLSKMQHYSTLFAEQNRHKKRSSFGKALLKGTWSFFRSYIIKLGILEGAEGFTLSLYNANTTFYKYLKLAEANRR